MKKHINFCWNFNLFTKIYYFLSWFWWLVSLQLQRNATLQVGSWMPSYYSLLETKKYLKSINPHFDVYTKKPKICCAGALKHTSQHEASEWLYYYFWLSVTSRHPSGTANQYMKMILKLHFYIILQPLINGFVLRFVCSSFPWTIWITGLDHCPQFCATHK